MQVHICKGSAMLWPCKVLKVKKFGPFTLQNWALQLRWMLHVATQKASPWGELPDEISHLPHCASKVLIDLSAIFLAKPSCQTWLGAGTAACLRLRAGADLGCAAPGNCPDLHPPDALHGKTMFALFFGHLEEGLNSSISGWKARWQRLCPHC